MFLFEKWLKGEKDARLMKNDLLNALAQTLVENEEEDIEFLTPEDEDQLTDTLADSFLDNPLMNWIVDLENNDFSADSEKESIVLQSNKWIMRGMNRHILNRKLGCVLGIPEKGNKDKKRRLVATMSIIPSSHDTTGPLDFILYYLSSYNSFPVKSCGPSYLKRIESLSVAGQKKYDHMVKKEGCNPKWIYLTHVGVRREYQNRGYGGKLFRTLFNTADLLQCPVFLEAASKENESLYIHYGFKTVETCDIEADGSSIMVYLMIRYPQ